MRILLWAFSFPRVISTFEDAHVREGEVLVTRLAIYIASWWRAAEYSGKRRRVAEGGGARTTGAGAAGGDGKRRRGPRAETVSDGGDRARRR